MLSLHRQTLNLLLGSNLLRLGSLVISYSSCRTQRLGTRLARIVKPFSDLTHWTRIHLSRFRLPINGGTLMEDIIIITFDDSFFELHRGGMFTVLIFN